MPIRHAVWRVGSHPTQLREVTLEAEELLERMIVSDPRILSEHWLLIGQQVRTAHGGYIDLLALNQDGQVIVIELKRGRTPREVVAQAIDYAAWVQHLEPDELAAIYDRFSGGGSLDSAFQERFGLQLDEEQLNGSHQIVIVASSLDFSTERIVGYLNSMSIAINVLCFQVFEDGEDRYLSRAWLIDPVETESNATASAVSAKGEWNGEYYVSFGESDRRSWKDAMRYAFICGGGGRWYSQTLFQLSEGDRVWVNVPKTGYVGVGRVTGQAIPLADFEVLVNGEPTPFLEVADGNYHREFIDDEERCEYFVPVEWIEARPIEQAVSEVGFFGNQNTVCRPRTTKWNHTVDRLRRHFQVE